MTNKTCAQVSQCSSSYKSQGGQTTIINCCSTDNCNNQTAATWTGLICNQGTLADQYKTMIEFGDTLTNWCYVNVSFFKIQHPMPLSYFF